MTYQATVGSISHGTLRPADLLESFADELDRLEPDHDLTTEARAVITQVSARYGAPMGRPDAMVDEGEKLYLTRVRLNSGGYDAGGAYWGLGAPLYAYGTGDGDWKYIRAQDRDAAKAKIRAAANVPAEQVRFYK